ncbi:MAG: D-alanyl-D-alanine carboxypeptidase (penicillin-binding protein 5/6) [bacterium]|nr:MAG: D-alanyl-D-alanine carboxypeptidase (penicillin-binding protein 5/6) [bacterium]KAF0147207.1 MAG: D-alanyl-D-alanine carboxypeptidase (penicillin-binding protein 5/6) [bacterium]KAF0167397.1 MAG: D-alanyl-D-alanine carboxypeptidase (penicillin-binding protein 5/6) [bacterium]TXT18639.1 MAG: D-alanyl-D-alanine carboxypeptidase (penicillin-binding protein 5/6) [bacterium]
MKPLRLIPCLALSCLSLVLPARAALPVPPPPQIEARAWLLIDAASGLPLAEKNADAKVEPASLTKLMTAYLAFSALKEGRLKPEQTLPVSEKAWKAEGSRMFLDPRKPARVDDLLKGVIVQSGNDACIVLAEAIAGSEEGFASMMNQTAKRLGMTGTHFLNSTGLPHPQHMTTARDLAKLAGALIRDFPEHYKLYSMREFAYNGITQPNRNRLLFMDPSVDGVKTGHTESAGHCLIASAQRERRRLLSVVLGAGSDSARAMESQKLLNYGFQFFETVKLYPANQTVASLRIYKGKGSQVKAGFLGDFHVTVPRGSARNIQAQTVTQQPLLAPVRRGQRLGTLRVSVDGQPVGEYPLLALEDIAVSGILGRGWDNILLMLR